MKIRYIPLNSPTNVVLFLLTNIIFYDTSIYRWETLLEDGKRKSGAKK